MLAVHDPARRYLGLLLAAAMTVHTPARAAPAAAEAPTQCMQLGGTLPCKVAEVSKWAYRADGQNFPDEASAYAHMLDTHPRGAIFTLTQRWGRGDRATIVLPPIYARSIEVSSWKLYSYCVRNNEKSPCETGDGVPGYRRYRQVVCPAGYRFSNDEQSPYCLPELAGAIERIAAIPR